ncbi:MAG: glycosyltransferase [bacterium]|nr:glycosyltransferase [bacterium]
MRIFQVTTQYREAGGEDSVVAAETELLRAAGHEVIEWRNANPAGGAAAAKALLQSPWNRKAAAEVASAAKAAQPDVVHVHNTWYATSPAAFPAINEAVDAPIVMTLHNYRLACANGVFLRDGAPCELCVGNGPWRAVRYGCYRESRPASVFAAATISVNRRRGSWRDNVDRYLALTEFAKGRLVASGLDESRIRIKPNFVPDPGNREAPPSASSQLLVVGRIVDGKGIVTLADAWQQAPPPGLELVAMGDGPLLDELRARDIAGMTFAGRVDHDEVIRQMSRSRALIFPSKYYEAMPMTLVEAFAAGLPVLGSARGAMTEMLAPLGDDWSVPAGDANAWSQALQRLANDGWVDEAGRVGRGLWEDLYGPQAALRNLEAAYTFNV